MDIQNKNLRNLLKLIQENPNLPVIPKVYDDIIGDDYSAWIGSIGSSFVGEIALLGERFYDDREDFIEAYYCAHDEELNERFDYHPNTNLAIIRFYDETFEAWDNNERQGILLDQYLDEVAEKYFKKVIIVNIDSPNDEFFKPITE